MYISINLKLKIRYEHMFGNIQPIIFKYHQTQKQKQSVLYYIYTGIILLKFKNIKYISKYADTILPASQIFIYVYINLVCSNLYIDIVIYNL